MGSYAGSELDSQELRSLAEDILSREEYAGARLELSPDWVSAILDWIEAFVRWIDGLYVTSPMQYWLFFGALVTVLFVLIAHMTWSISVALRRSPEQTSPEVFTAPRNFAREAQQLAADGRHLEGAHQLFLASLQRAAQSGLIELQPDDTNAVVRAAIESSSIPSALRVELVALVGVTEQAWFGDRANDPELYARWAQAYGQLVHVTK